MSLFVLTSIGIGGFCGAIMRYVIANQMSLILGSEFPYGTLTVNAVGSLLIGFLSRFFMEHLVIPEVVRYSLLIGFLGAFTTFSTFSYETITLLQEGDVTKAFINILSNTVICLILCLFGLQLAKLL